MTYDELAAKIQTGAYDTRLALPTGFGAICDAEREKAMTDYHLRRRALEAQFRKDLAGMLHDEYGLSKDKAEMVYARAISNVKSDGSDMSLLAAARDIVRFVIAVAEPLDTDDIPEPSHACPVCGANVNEDGNVNLEESDEDGYGEMTAPATCPTCGAKLTAVYVSDGYRFDRFKTT